MTKHERTSEKHGEPEMVKRHTVKEAPPLFDELMTAYEGLFEFTFEPIPERHAALLADANSDGHQAKLLTQLQQSYGNAYVQRLLRSDAVQAKPPVSPPDNEYKKEPTQQSGSISPLSSRIQRSPDPDRRVATLVIPWGNFEDFQRAVEEQASSQLGVPAAWLPQLISTSNLRAVYDELESRRPDRPDGITVRILAQFDEIRDVGHSRLRFATTPMGLVTEAGEPEVGGEEGTTTEEEEEEAEEAEMTGEEAVGEATGGSTGGPEESRIAEILSRLDQIRETLGATASLLDIVGVAAAETASAALGVVGCIAAIPLGLYSIGQANEYPYEVSYRQGYAWAFVDMSEGRNPNSRPYRATLGPHLEWEMIGRNEAIRYVNGMGPQQSVPIFVGLSTGYPDPQARLDAIWDQLIESMSEPGRTNASSPTVRPRY